MNVHETASKAWSESAEVYERARPGYPPEAIEFLHKLGLGPDSDVLDLAAGTGKLTRALIAAGARVTAVEPLFAMRQMLLQRLPEATIMEGTAEDIPAEDASMDLVTVAQAFHWFDGDRALAEIYRVTRPASRLAVIYNRRPLEHPIQAALEEILRPYRGGAPAHLTGRWREAFTRTSLWAPAEEAELPHVQRLDRDGVLARIASTSFIAALPVDQRTQVLEQARALVADRSEPLELPYVCELFVWTRLPDAQIPRRRSARLCLLDNRRLRV